MNMTRLKPFPISLFCFFLLYSLVTNAQVDFKLTTTDSTSVLPEEAPTNRMPMIRQLNLLYEVQETDLAQEEETLSGKNGEKDGEGVVFSEDISQKSFKVKVLLRFFSTANLAKIHLKVGSEPGKADFDSQVFEFDGQQQSAPYSYARSGKTIVLGLSEVIGIPSYYAEVILENKDGMLSEPVYCGPDL